MWNYSDKVMDHFMNPRNVGAVEDPDGLGEVGSMACGDALRLTFKLDADGRIEEARFQTFGCGSAIASSSMLTEMIKGKTLEEAARITNEDIAEALGGLPREKMHCSVMGREALEAAMIDYYKRQGLEVPCHLLRQGVMVCHCFQVTRDTIREAIRANRLRTVEDITNFTKAGGGCGDCHHDLEHLLVETWEDIEREETGVGARPAEEQFVSKEMSAAEQQLLDRIREHLEHDIAPALRQDGGDIELVRVNGNRVFVRLVGQCAACRASDATIKGWVESQLREHVNEDLEVIEVKT
jgi:NifU-like protein